MPFDAVVRSKTGRCDTVALCSPNSTSVTYSAYSTLSARMPDYHTTNARLACWQLELPIPVSVPLIRDPLKLMDP